MRESAGRIRLNLAITPDVKARLEDLQHRTSADSMTEVIRRSLAVYERLVELDEQGSQLKLEGPDGEDLGKLWIVPA
ncbi:MAG: hypothetical protein GY708_01110 [Actinomycetia bacterium]|nr:hypothetical protein [Actinomycetes bacterium]